MQPETKLDLDEIASEYLSSVQSLNTEIVNAVTAIAHDDLVALNRHIEAQAGVCARLLELEPYRPSLCSLPETWHSISLALQSLNQNNHVYRALLEFSGRSHQVLLTLCRAFNGSQSHGAGQCQGVSSLSCEI